MRSVLVDDHGSALGAFASLQEGIKALRKLYEAEPAAKDEVALLVFDKDGERIEIIGYEDVMIDECA